MKMVERDEAQSSFQIDFQVWNIRLEEECVTCYKT